MLPTHHSEMATADNRHSASLHFHYHATAGSQQALPRQPAISGPCLTPFPTGLNSKGSRCITTLFTQEAASTCSCTPLYSCRRVNLNLGFSLPK